MDNNLLLLAFLSFTAGYIFKTIIYSYRTYTVTASFVRKISLDMLVLVSEVVYNVSFIEQLYTLSLEKAGMPEDAKKIKIDLDMKFEEWKGGLVKNFIENYPKEYRWQLDFTDWDGIIKEVDDIYKQGKE